MSARRRRDEKNEKEKDGKKTGRARAGFRLLPPVLRGQTAGPSPFGESVEVNIVNVEVFVADKDGKPVSGLRRGDFELREDGKAMSITNFEAFRQTPEPAAGPGRPAAGSSRARKFPRPPWPIRCTW